MLQHHPVKKISFCTACDLSTRKARRDDPVLYSAHSLTHCLLERDRTASFELELLATSSLNTFCAETASVYRVATTRGPWNFKNIPPVKRQTKLCPVFEYGIHYCTALLSSFLAHRPCVEHLLEHVSTSRFCLATILAAPDAHGGSLYRELLTRITSAVGHVRTRGDYLQPLG